MLLPAEICESEARSTEVWSQKATVLNKVKGQRVMTKVDSQIVWLLYVPHVSMVHFLFWWKLGFNFSLHYEPNDYAVALLMLIQWRLRSVERH